MGVYQENSGINIVERFWEIDPITEASTPADPTDVYIHIIAPDDTDTVYHYPGDPEITRSAVGLYILGPLTFAVTGTYRWWGQGTGVLEAVSPVETFTILPDGSLQPPDAVPLYGPCQSWISGDDVAACGPDLGLGSNTWRLDQVAFDASALLYEITGRQYPGVCERTVRPCRDQCNHWGSFLSPWPASSWGDDFLGIYGWDGWWRDQRGDRCGCGPISEIKLAGFPVRRIVEVKIGGVVLAPLDSNSNPTYRLDRNRLLVRMNDPTDPSRDLQWPSCQNLALNDDQPGTFSVTYAWGMEPPSIASMAAAQLARELWNACTGSDCALPSGVTQIVRQGITINRVHATAELLRSGGTNIPIVDAFIAGANDGTKRQRRPVIFSPDVTPYGRRVG